MKAEDVDASIDGSAGDMFAPTGLLRLTEAELGERAERFDRMMSAGGDRSAWFRWHASREALLAALEIIREPSEGADTRF